MQDQSIDLILILSGYKKCFITREPHFKRDLLNAILKVKLEKLY